MVVVVSECCLTLTRLETANGDCIEGCLEGWGRCHRIVVMLSHHRAYEGEGEGEGGFEGGKTASGGYGPWVALAVRQRWAGTGQHSERVDGVALTRKLT